MAETSTKPYLIRALYEWCCDNGYTPYLAVVVDQHTLVPRQHVKNGEIVLNVSPMATNHMQMGNELIEFQARFSGIAQQLSIPVDNVAAVYARETGHGMAFEVTRPAPAEEGGEDSALQGDGGGANEAVPAAGVGAEQAVSSPAQDIRTAARAPAGRKRAAGKAQGGADVIAFGSPAASRGKGATDGKGGAPAPSKGGKGTRQEAGEGASNVQGAEPSASHPEDHDEPPPSAGGKGGRTRLTRVK